MKRSSSSKLHGKFAPQKYSKLKRVVKVFLVVIVVIGLSYFLLQWGDQNIEIHNQPLWNQKILTSHQCRGTSDIGRICMYENLVLYKGILYYIVDDTNIDDAQVPDVDFAIIPKFVGEGVIYGNQIQNVRFEDSPLALADNIQEINIGLFQHRYDDMTYERTLLAHTPLLHKHLCQKFGICSYTDNQDMTVVFWDNQTQPVNTWEKAAQQVWSCFTKQHPIEMSVANNQDTVYFFRQAVIGIGDQCLDFYGCNSRVVGTARRSLLWGYIILSWRQKIQECSKIIKIETLKKDTRLIGHLRYEGPKNFKLDEESNEQRVIRFVDRVEEPPRFQGIQEMSDSIGKEFGRHFIETKKLDKDANLWERIDLFSGADIIISPFWDALNGVMFMKNCSCLVVVYPMGLEPMFYDQQIETLMYGNVGLASYFGKHLQMYVFGYTIPNPQNTKVKWDFVQQSDERFDQLSEETHSQIQNELKCGRQPWSKDCQLKWINEFSTIYLDVAYFTLSMRFAMKTTEQCFKNTYPSEFAYAMWPLSSCIPAVFEDLQGWIVNTKGIAKVLPPGPSFPEACDKHCNLVYGWIHGGEILRVEEWDYPSQCCQVCTDDPECNAWNYCQCFDRCGDYHRRSCILKKVKPSPYHAYIQGDINEYNRFIGGFPKVGHFHRIQECSPKIIPDTESEEYKNQKKFLNCPDDDCNVQTGNLTNSKFLDDKIQKIIINPDLNSNITPAECCKFCKELDKCNIWTICNSPEGCPCDINANGLNGCNNGMLQAYTCILKYSENIEQGKRPEKFEQGKFTSLISGYLQEKNEHEDEAISAFQN